MGSTSGHADPSASPVETRFLADLLEQDPRVPGVVVLDRLRAAGYSGGHTIFRDYLKQVRVSGLAPRTFVRMEPAAGERFEIDWGHFGTLDY